jgi:ankyrin repeat protein
MGACASHKGGVVAAELPFARDVHPQSWQGGFQGLRNTNPESTPLMKASRKGEVETAKLLLEDGANPDQENNEKWTALMAAAHNGRGEIVEILLHRKADPNKQDITGWSALMAAVYKHHDDIVEQLLKGGATPLIQDKNKTNALLLAINENGTSTVMISLLNHVQSHYLNDTDGVCVVTELGLSRFSFLCLARRNCTYLCLQKDES